VAEVSPPTSTAKQEDPTAALALVVDHGLRAESAEEATGVANAAALLGLTPHVLRVGWAQGLPRLQDKLAAARDARYGLLVDACSRLGRANLLVAHHAGMGRLAQVVCVAALAVTLQVAFPHFCLLPAGRLSSFAELECYPQLRYRAAASGIGGKNCRE
jgi:hypothetical protein